MSTPREVRIGGVCLPLGPKWWTDSLLIAQRSVVKTSFRGIFLLLNEDD